MKTLLDKLIFTSVGFALVAGANTVASYQYSVNKPDSTILISNNLKSAYNKADIIELTMVQAEDANESDDEPSSVNPIKVTSSKKNTTKEKTKKVAQETTNNTNTEVTNSPIEGTTEITDTQDTQNVSESETNYEELNNSEYTTNNISLGQQIANFAVQFVGNPYKSGGTSLTNGADCSGFTQTVFANFGISLSRTSSQQATNGVYISIDQLQPGDLVFYGYNGSVSHVALYIGNNQVVHAMNPTDRIKITNLRFGMPLITARRVIN